MMRVVDNGGGKCSDEFQVGTVYRNKDDKSLHLCVRLEDNVKSPHVGAFLLCLAEHTVTWWSKQTTIDGDFVPVTATLTVGADP